MQPQQLTISLFWVRIKILSTLTDTGKEMSLKTDSSLPPGEFETGSMMVFANALAASLEDRFVQAGGQLHMVPALNGGGYVAVCGY
jgi:hypothetical protein